MNDQELDQIIASVEYGTIRFQEMVLDVVMRMDADYHEGGRLLIYGRPSDEDLIYLRGTNHDLTVLLNDTDDVSSISERIITVTGVNPNIKVTSYNGIADLEGTFDGIAFRQRLPDSMDRTDFRAKIRMAQSRVASHGYFAVAVLNGTLNARQQYIDQVNGGEELFFPDGDELIECFPSITWCIRSEDRFMDPDMLNAEPELNELHGVVCGEFQYELLLAQRKT